MTGIKYLMSIADTEPILLAPTGRKVKAKKPKAPGQSVGTTRPRRRSTTSRPSPLQAGPPQDDFRRGKRLDRTAISAAAIFDTGSRRLGRCRLGRI